MRGHRIVSPRTLPAWRQRLVKKKRTQPPSPGHPRLPEEIRDLIIRLGTKNHRWGFRRVHGELRRLGHKISPSSVRRVPRAAGLGCPGSRKTRENGTLAKGRLLERALRGPWRLSICRNQEPRPCDICPWLN
ncbi:IS3 family transposase [Streptomyces sp. NPDC054933]